MSLDEMIAETVAKTTATTLDKLIQYTSGRNEMISKWPVVMGVDDIVEHVKVTKTKATQWFNIKGFPRIEDGTESRLVGREALYRWLNKETDNNAVSR